VAYPMAFHSLFAFFPWPNFHWKRKGTLIVRYVISSSLIVNLVLHL
jgi:hypothetical protein